MIGLGRTGPGDFPEVANLESCVFYFGAYPGGVAEVPHRLASNDLAAGFCVEAEIAGPDIREWPAHGHDHKTSGLGEGATGCLEKSGTVWADDAVQAVAVKRKIKPPVDERGKGSRVPDLEVDVEALLQGAFAGPFDCRRRNVDTVGAPSLLREPARQVSGSAANLQHGAGHPEPTRACEFLEEGDVGGGGLGVIPTVGATCPTLSIQTLVAWVVGAERLDTHRWPV